MLFLEDEQDEDYIWGNDGNDNYSGYTQSAVTN
jgi:hypothetical protein